MSPKILSLVILIHFYINCISQTSRNFADINGDGKSDRIEYKDYGGNIHDILIYLATTNGYETSPILIDHIDIGYSDKQWGFADVNCDGMADFITIRGGGGPDKKFWQFTYLSNGTGYDLKNPIETEYHGSISLKIYQNLKGEGAYLGPPGHSEGMSTTMHCGNSPESWIRANARLDQSSGVFFITVQLETDATFAGPKGRVTAVLKACDGTALASITTDEIGRGGKSPGRAERSNHSSQIKINPAVACKVCSIELSPECTGSIDRWFNIKLDSIIDAFKLFILIF